MKHKWAIRRTIGFVVILITGGGLMILGIQKGSALDMIPGLAGRRAGAYSWGYTIS